MTLFIGDAAHAFFRLTLTQTLNRPARLEAVLPDKDVAVGERITAGALFTGRVFRTTRTANAVTVVAYDTLHALTSRETMWIAPEPPAPLIRRLCALAGLDTQIADIPGVCAQRLFSNARLIDIIDFVLEGCGAHVLEARGEKSAALLPAPALAPFIAAEREEGLTIEGLITRAKVLTLRGKADEAQAASDEDLIQRFGVYQSVTRLERETPPAAALSTARRILEKGRRAMPSARITALGDTTLRAGGLYQGMICREARHVFEHGHHTTHLTLGPVPWEDNTNG